MRTLHVLVPECPYCGEEKLEIGDGDVKCRSCKRSTSPEKMADEYISAVLRHRHSTDAKEHVPWPRYECPSCNVDAMVEGIPIDEGHHAFFCFACGEHWDEHDLDLCGYSNHYYELGPGAVSGICSECLAEKTSKD
jgi:transposase-like protein